MTAVVTGHELAFRDVGVRYGSGRTALQAVDGVDLTVPPGAVVGLVGESGSGKSTLARAAVGLAPVTSGEILLDGAPIMVRRGRRPVQMVFQDPQSAFDPRQRIGDAIGEARPDLDRRARRAEAERLLELVQLDGALAGRLPGELSGGQRQRAALARALAARPDVLVADEITSALDVSVQGAVLNVLREVQRELALSVLFISHNLAVVRHVSDVVAVMYLGRVVEVAPPDELVANPQHPYTRLLLSAVPSLDDPDLLHRPADARLVAEPADPHAPPPGCRFHPRCPVGPLVDDARELCRTDDPSAGAAERPHRAACHFAGETA
ncbi:ABC transporter ATP-binding protein [Jatrophihabitans fulvus]